MMIGIPNQRYVCAYCRKSLNYTNITRCPYCNKKLYGLIIKEPYEID